MRKVSESPGKGAVRPRGGNGSGVIKAGAVREEVGMMPGLSGAGNLHLAAGYMVCSVCETAVIQYTCNMCVLVCVNTKKFQKFTCTFKAEGVLESM